MSAMLDTYDMQMTDYHTDLDIQMHQSSSDQWFQDEAKMEEDVPALKLENSFVLKPEGHLKTDLYSQEKLDGTIEVDMEPISDHQNAEYDMLDDEEIQDSGADIDVEVYDASRGHSPAMGALDTSQGAKSRFVDTFESTETNDTLDQDLPPEPLGDTGEKRVDLHELESENVESVLTAQKDESVSFAHIAQFGAESEPLEASISQQSNFQTETPRDGYEVEERHTINSEVSLFQVLTTELIESSDPDSSEIVVVHPPNETSQDNSDENQPLTQPGSADNSLGDPHEISEGVYIDPPPPVLLSLSSEEQFTFALFNKPAEWNSPLQSPTVDHLLLHQLPTLYYEPLSSVFEALRREEVIGSTFLLAEGELVLDAVDLQLSISEDNIYAREVALHDLNVLHDVSGVSGLLRIRLYTSMPRFIVRYQQLQAQVNQPNFEPPSGEVSGGGIGITGSSGEENPEEKDQETIQTPHEAEDQHWKPLEPLLGTGWTTNENSHDDKELNDPRAEISHEEEPGLDTHEDAQNHENPSEGAEEIPNRAFEETNEEGPQELLEESYDETYDEGYEESSDTPEQVLSTLPDVQQTTADNHNVSYPRLSEQGNHEVSPLHSDLENNVIPLELLEADPTDNGPVEQASNESYRAATGVQLSKTIGENLDERDAHEENFEHSEGATIKLPEVPEPAGVANKLEQDPSYAESENIGEITTPEPTLEDPSAIRGVFDPHSIDLEADDDYLNLESTEDPTMYGEEVWQDDPDGAGDINGTWDDENENALSNSTHSSVTLSSKASKRTFDEFESREEGYDGSEGGHSSPPSPRDPKRSRTQ